MTINYTKQKLEMTTITQNKIEKVVPWGGGGANGEEMQSIILDNGEKEKAVLQETKHGYIQETFSLKCSLVTSLKERTAQNVRSFKLSDRFERCANSFV
jgi:hypothetical protein